MAIPGPNTTELLREKVARSRNVSIDFLFDEKKPYYMIGVGIFFLWHWYIINPKDLDLNYFMFL